MNKSELIDQIAKSAGISKAAAGRTLDATTAAITKALKRLLNSWLIAYLVKSASLQHL